MWQLSRLRLCRSSILIPQVKHCTYCFLGGPDSACKLRSRSMQSNDFAHWFGNSNCNFFKAHTNRFSSSCAGSSSSSVLARGSRREAKGFATVIFAWLAVSSARNDKKKIGLCFECFVTRCPAAKQTLRAVRCRGLLHRAAWCASFPTLTAKRRCMRLEPPAFAFLFQPPVEPQAWDTDGLRITTPGFLCQIPSHHRAMHQPRHDRTGFLQTRVLVFAALVAWAGILVAATLQQYGTLWSNPIVRHLSNWPSNAIGESRCNQFQVPYTASWRTWWHAHWSSSHGRKFDVASVDVEETRKEVPSQGGGDIDQDWNILYHLGGNGPWVEKTDGSIPEGIAVPEGCVVDQVHMISRHAERYPTVRVGNRMIDLLARIKASNVTLAGDLAFVNRWVFFSNDPQRHFDQLTTTGPYAGTLNAFTTGVKLRSRYEHLLPRRLSGRRKTNFWASDCTRVIDTARYFAAGFFGLNWQDTATLHVIPETEDRGGDTLTPGDTCLKYIDDVEHGHDQGAVKLAQFRATYLGAVRRRLKQQNPGIEFTDDEVYAMQEMCGFETTVRGSSMWCDVFTKDEWLSFEYARDVIHYYRAGPGTKRYGAAMGWLWLNATANLMAEGPEAGPLFFSL